MAPGCLEPGAASGGPQKRPVSNGCTETARVGSLKISPRRGKAAKKRRYARFFQGEAFLATDPLIPQPGDSPARGLSKCSVLAGGEGRSDGGAAGQPGPQISPRSTRHRGHFCQQNCVFAKCVEYSTFPHGANLSYSNSPYAGILQLCFGSTVAINPNYLIFLLRPESKH